MSHDHAALREIKRESKEKEACWRFDEL